MTPPLVEMMARAMARGEGLYPDADTQVGGPEGMRVTVATWATFRVRALMLVDGITAEVGANGVGFMGSAYALAKSAHRVARGGDHG